MNNEPITNLYFRSYFFFYGIFIGFVVVFNLRYQCDFRFACLPIALLIKVRRQFYRPVHIDLLLLQHLKCEYSIQNWSVYVKNSRHFANTQCILLFLYSKTRDFMCMNYVILVFCGIRLTILCPYNRQLIYDRLIIFNTLKLKMHYNISNVCASQAMTAINSSVRIYLLNEIL